MPSLLSGSDLMVTAVGGYDLSFDNYSIYVIVLVLVALGAFLTAIFGEK